MYLRRAPSGCCNCLFFVAVLRKVYSNNPHSLIPKAKLTYEIEFITNPQVNNVNLKRTADCSLGFGWVLLKQTCRTTPFLKPLHKPIVYTAAQPIKEGLSHCRTGQLPHSRKSNGHKKMVSGLGRTYGKPTFPKRLVVPTSHPESGCQAKHVAETTHPTASMYGRYTYLRRYLPNISSQCKHISYVIVFSHQESLLTSINRCCITLGRCCPRWR